MGTDRAMENLVGLNIAAQQLADTIVHRVAARRILQHVRFFGSVGPEYADSASFAAHVIPILDIRRPRQIATIGPSVKLKVARSVLPFSPPRPRLKFFQCGPVIAEACMTV